MHLIYRDVRHYYYYPILQDTGTSIIFFPISAALMPYLRLFVPQCNKIYSGLFDIVGYMYNFMSLVVASLKCFVTTLLFLSDNSNSVTSLTTDAPKITVTGSFFLRSFFLSGLCLLLFSVTFSLLWLLQPLLLYGVFPDTSDTCSS